MVLYALYHASLHSISLDDWLHAACHEVSKVEVLVSNGTVVLIMQLGVWVLLRVIRLMFRFVIERSVVKDGREKA